MTSKKGATWSITDYDGQRALGIISPQVTKAWVDSVSDWWRKTAK